MGGARGGWSHAPLAFARSDSLAAPGEGRLPPSMSDVGTLVWVDWAPHCPRRALGARMRKRGVRMAEARGGTQTALASDRPPASGPSSLPGGGAPYAIAAGITAAAVLRRGAFYR